MLPPPPRGAAKEVSHERWLVAHCLALCAGCERCRFVTLSAQWNDCRCLGLG